MTNFKYGSKAKVLVGATMGTWKWFMILLGCLLSWWYPIIFLFSIISYFSFHLFLRINRDLVVPFQWPVLGMLPGLAANSDRVFDFATGLLREASGCTFKFKGPWLTGLEFVITCNPANAKHMYNTHFSNYPKGDDFMEIFDILKNGIFTVDGKLWSKQRHKAHTLLTNKDFRNSMAKCNRDKIEKVVLPLLDRMACLDQVVDLQDLIKRYTTDVMSTLVLGKDLNCLAPDLPHIPFAEAIEDAEHVILYRHTVPTMWWKLLRWLCIGEEKRMAIAINVIDNFIAQCIEEKRKEEGWKSGRLREEASKDLLTSYMYSPPEDIQYGDYFSSDNFIRDTLFTLLAAGNDTTSGALSWFFWLVSKSPRVEQKILEELRQHQSKQEQTEVDDKEHCMIVFDVEQTQGMVYLHAALCETLRLFPAIPFNHKTALKDDILPSGHRVGSGTMVLFCTYSTGRMEKFWGEDCLEFKPERWISSDGQLKHMQSHDFLAFHSGPRSCLGKAMAFIQMKALAAAIVYNFHVEAVEGCSVQPTVSMVLQMKNGLRVKIRKRERSY